jgi:hypothetical protein
MNIGKVAPLSGAVAVVVVIAGFAAPGSAPSDTASVARVSDYYGSHTGAQTTSGVLLGFAALLFLVFSATLVARLREADAAATSGSTSLCLLGAGIFAAGLATYAGVAIAMGDVGRDLDGTALQALNALSNGPVFVFLLTIGASAFLFGAGSATLATSTLPRWLGWLAYAVAAAAIIPSHVLGGTLDHIGIVPFAGLGVWTIAAGVALVRPGAGVRLPASPALHS